MKLLSFDCYGTLIDWESGILESLKPVLENHGVDLKDEEILEAYARFESEIEREYKPYKAVLREVVDSFGREYGFTPSREERDVLVRSITNWKPFEEVNRVLRALKDRYKLAVISNTDGDIISKSIERIGVEFDYVVTSEMVGAYKPSLEVFRKAQEIFGVEKGDWIHVAQSLYHDVIPAKDFGLKTVLVKRRGYGATPRVRGEADHVVDDLEGLLSISPSDL